MSILYIIKTMRPKDWVKNIFVLSPLIYSQLLDDFGKVVSCLMGFVLFCLISGCVYIINDLKDVFRDKLHPINKLRPLAAGKINKKQLFIAVSFISPISIIASYKLNFLFGIIISIYLLMNIFYSIKLKNIIILDIFIISLGYVLRVLGGGILVDIDPSPWVVMATFFLALFLSCSKRRGEIQLVEKNIIDKTTQRKTLKKYTIELLDQYLIIMGSGAIISYAIYTASDYTFDKFNTHNLIYTTIFVIYGIFRYYYLIMVKEIVISPNEILFRDIPLIINLFMWIITTIVIIGV